MKIENFHREIPLSEFYKLEQPRGLKLSAQQRRDKKTAELAGPLADARLRPLATAPHWQSCTASKCAARIASSGTGRKDSPHGWPLAPSGDLPSQQREDTGTPVG